MTRSILATACAAMAAFGAAVVGAAQAPAPAANLVEEVQRMYTSVQNNIVAGAEQFPEDKYTWQPTPDVRSWARLVGHVTDDNTGACWSLAGVAARPPMVDMPNSAESAANKKTKADLVAGLKASIDLCTKAFAAVTPANMNEPNGTRSKIGGLIYNTSHTNEHYGNFVTYMRLQNLVPPSSQPRGGGPGRGRGN